MTRATPSFLEIDLSRLRQNVRYWRETIPSEKKIMAIVKSDAYGHGAPEVACALQEAGVSFFGVGTLDEGIELRESGIQGEILLMLGVLDKREAYLSALAEHRLMAVLEDWPTARLLNDWGQKSQRRLSVHIKVDTGMSRLGFLTTESDETLKKLFTLPSLQIKGLLSHLSDSTDRAFTKQQVAQFKSFVERAALVGLRPKLIHMANSAEASFSPELFGNAVRLGLALYTHPKTVMSLKSSLISVRRVPKGSSVSYGRTFKTKRESLVGTVPLGYADGYPRALSNKGVALVRGVAVPVLGTICMDLLMLDLTDVPGASVGDELVFMGSQGDCVVTPDDLAARAGTISYELFCSLSKRMRRCYTDRLSS